jgi:Restriction endonuclease
MHMKPGKSLENLTRHLENVLANDKESIIVESPKKLPDFITGKPREHDIVITVKERHHELKIAIECRDRSRPITVNQVEGFWAKCQHTGINQGIIVSAKGFYNTALKKAEALGIRCFNLEQATSLCWILPKEMEIFRRILRFHWTIVPCEDINDSMKDFKLVDLEDNEISEETLKSNAYRKFDEYEKTLNGSVIKPIMFTFNGTGLLLKNIHNNRLISIKHLISRVDYEIRHESAPIILLKYRDKQHDTDLLDAALMQFSLGNKEASVVITGKDGEHKNIAIL